MYDVIIVGGGPAGLSAALILGRCLRKVLLIDNGQQRNAYSNALHGYLTRDGTPPKEFIQTSRAELLQYETVSLVNGEAVEATKADNVFSVTLVDGMVNTGRKLLIATGVLDNIPSFEGMMDFYGKSVHTCPYCDAWELKGRPLSVFGKDGRGTKLSISMKTWTEDIVLITDGPGTLEPDERRRLQLYNIKINEKKVLKLEGKDGKLECIVFEDGERLKREALFINTASFIKSKLLEQLSCEFDQITGVQTGKYESTNVPGLFVAGNICREVQLVIVAAGEGAEAAFGINTSLSGEDRP